MLEKLVRDDDALQAIFEKVSNTHRWGSDDVLGTLNFIDAAKRVEAARLVTEGLSVSLSRPFKPDVQHMVFVGSGEASAYDYFGVACHGLVNTHLDALAHSQFEGRMYNGVPITESFKRDGVHYGAITAQGDGIFTRGVLLDVAGALGLEWFPPGSGITVADLEAAEQMAGVTVGRGDALFVRCGFLDYVAGHGIPSARPGLLPETYEWMHEREIAVYGGDCTEPIPYPSDRFTYPLHAIGLVSMGLILLDHPEVERLADTCRELGRYEFLLTVAPLLLEKGTGSPVNPVATF
ncbi:cyclase [Acrocarpospora pleiomorpha]|uniref:Cyclase n=1 Tax=Acrocarpospora pleiomorpha TaxID=90975 RepID=A0A5M3X6N6_9ACTN|nr:cyclase family protein [Acrocarpospora pleiomorpha]GES17357.1 cyclase [Acrocarpospora pleiomorpha]